MGRLSIVMADKSRFSIAFNRTDTLWRLLDCVLVLMVMGAWHETLLADQQAPGKALVMERTKGNCLACHVVDDGKLAGNVGPPLVGMKARFPDAETLYRQIWDASDRNPDSRMPPFGRHGILTAKEINLVVEYLYTL